MGMRPGKIKIDKIDSATLGKDIKQFYADLKTGEAADWMDGRIYKAVIRGWGGLVYSPLEGDEIELQVHRWLELRKKRYGGEATATYIGACVEKYFEDANSISILEEAYPLDVEEFEKYWYTPLDEFDGLTRAELATKFHSG